MTATVDAYAGYFLLMPNQILKFVIRSINFIMKLPFTDKEN